MTSRTSSDPHAAQPVVTLGPALSDAHAAVIILHGRGADANDILPLAHEIDVAHVAWLAPDAADNAWYPDRFMEPIARNEPWLTSALTFVHRTVAQVVAAGIPADRIVLAGFSQGACLALEYAARHPRRYGGLVGLSGGLIGAENELGPYSGSLEGTPVFLGCSDVDPHIPAERVRFTAGALRDQGAEVTMRFYPGMGHMVNQDELDAVRSMLEQLKKGSSKEG
jgi:phospholipase/carboxylesterase